VTAERRYVSLVKKLTIAGVSVALGALVFACVGDDSTTPDGGTDATTDQLNGDTGGGDAGDAAADVSLGKITQVDVGDSYACVVLSGGSVWCWGNNAGGESAGDAQVNVQAPLEVAGLPAVGMKAVTAGGISTCALANDGTVWCWGLNDVGQLGHAPLGGAMSVSGATVTDIQCSDGRVCNPIPTQVPGLLATDVVMSTAFACAITVKTGTSGGNVVCWGNSVSGELGVLGNDDGGVAGLTTVGGAMALPVKALGGGFPGGTACAIDANTTVWCWGDNTYGQVGHTPGTLGDQVYASGPRYAATPHEVTLSPDGGGTAFTNADAVHTGNATCAVQNGQVWCWGSNVAGALGNNTTDSNPHPTPTMLTITEQAQDIRGGNSMCYLGVGGGVYCWGADEAVNVNPGTAACTDYSGNAIGSCVLKPTAIAGLTCKSFDVDHVSAAAFILAMNEVLAWGDNTHGELGHTPGTDGDFMDGGSNYLNTTPTQVPLP
jgi:alpha-tubulin suppressor-like RCC1 family protein